MRLSSTLSSCVLKTSSEGNFTMNMDVVLGNGYSHCKKILLHQDETWYN